MRLAAPRDGKDALARAAHGRSRRCALAAALIAAAPLASAATARAQAPSFIARREDHLHRQQAILGYLTGAAALSLAGGTALLLAEPPGFAGKPRDFRTSFAAFALLYGALNSAFVAANFAGLDSQRGSLRDAAALEQNRRQQTRAFIGNTGLDMIYITLGFTLWATDRRPVVQGMGASLALQGGFLLGFDGAGGLAMSR